MHGVDDEIGSIWGTDSVVEGEHVTGKLFVEGVGNLACNEVSNGCRDIEWGWV